VDDPLPVVSDLPVDPPNSSTLDPLPGVAALPGSVEDELPAAGIDDEPPLAPTVGVVVLAPPVVAVEPPAEGMVDELSVVGIEDEPPVAPTDGFVVVAPPVVVVEPLFEVLVLVCANATLDRAAAKVAARRAFFIIHSSLLPRVGSDAQRAKTAGRQRQSRNGHQRVRPRGDRTPPCASFCGVDAQGNFRLCG
jgi:hypothetical protein